MKTIRKVSKFTWSIFAPAINKVEEMRTGKAKRDSSYITYTKNLDRLLHALILDSEFAVEIIKLRLIGGIIYPIPLFPKQLGSISDEVKVEEFLINLGKKEKQDFITALDDFMVMFNYAKEWKEPLLNFLINNVLDGPLANCYISEITMGSRKRLAIEVNEFTKKEDIMDILPFLFKERDRLFPKRYRQYKSKKFSRNLGIVSQTYINQKKSEKRKFNKRQKEREMLTDAGIAKKILGKVNLETITAKEDRRRSDVIRKGRKYLLNQLQQEQELRK